MDKKVLRELSYGLYAIGANDGNKPTGCIVNTVFQITSENPIVALSMNKNNYTFQAITKKNKFTVSLLSEQTSPNLIAQLGFSSGRDTDKCAGLNYQLTTDGLPLFAEQTVGFLTCEVLSIHDAETHNVILARVLDAQMGEGGTPMTYRYYHEVIKGRAPKNAPTYVAPEEEKSSGKQCICDICGYIYNGSLSDMPEDFRCPVCGADKSHFKEKE